MSFFKKRYILKNPPVNTVFVSGGEVIGGLKLIGNWAGSTNIMPLGTIKAGYMWSVVSNTTTLLGPDGGVIQAGMMILALVDDPGGNPADTTKWKIMAGVS